MIFKDKILLGLGIGLISIGIIFGSIRTYYQNTANLVSNFAFSPALAATSTQGVSLSTTVQQVLAATIDSATQNLGNLTPGTPVFATSTLTVSTNDNLGYSTRVSQNNTTTTAALLQGGTITFPELTDWSAGANTSTAGNATTTPLSNLGFHPSQNTVYTSACNSASSWWGSSDAAGTAQYAGFPFGGGNYSTSTIANCPNYNSGSTTVAVMYRADAPTTQQTGTYSGGITYTIFGN